MKISENLCFSCICFRFLELEKRKIFRDQYAARGHMDEVNKESRPNLAILHKIREKGELLPRGGVLLIIEEGLRARKIGGI